MITKSHVILSIAELSTVSGGEGINMPLSGPTHVAPVTTNNWAMGGEAIGTKIGTQIINQFQGGESKLPGESMAKWRQRNPHLRPYNPRPIHR